MTTGGGRTVRIAMILPYLVRGGAEGQLLALVRGIDRGRFDPFVVALAGGGELEAEFRASGVPVDVLGYAGISPGRGAMRRTVADSVRCVRRLAGLLRERNTGIAHAWLPAANALAPLAARIAGTGRTIVGKRALSEYKERYRLAASAESFGNRLADVILVNSDAVRRDVERTERHWEGKFRRIYNGVAPIAPWAPAEVASFREREGLPPRAPILLSVSNFFAYKGHDDLVAGIARIAGDFPDATWVLVGRDAGALEGTRALAGELGVLPRLRFAGPRSDVTEFLRAADLFVHPSHQEGFSNAILEAMAAGLPVIACDVGGNPEAVVDGGTGRLVPPRSPGRLAEAMAELLRDEGKRRGMGEAGRRRAEERFSIGRMVAEVEAMYGSLALRRAGGR